jgi:ribose transport system substrate-binding protein
LESGEVDDAIDSVRFDHRSDHRRIGDVGLDESNAGERFRIKQSLQTMRFGAVIEGGDVITDLQQPSDDPGADTAVRAGYKSHCHGVSCLPQVMGMSTEDSDRQRRSAPRAGEGRVCIAGPTIEVYPRRGRMVKNQASLDGKQLEIGMFNRSRGIRILATLTTLMATMTIASFGCDGSGSVATKADTEGGAATARTFAVIPKGTSHEFWKAVHAGAVKAGNELGVEIIWQGPAREDDRDDQIKVVEQFITKRVDGIVIAPLDDTALVRPLKEASEAGIPVVVIDSSVNWDGSITFAATDNFEGGVRAAREMGRQLGGKGRVVVMRYVEGSASTTKREQGFLDTIRSDFPDVEMLSDNSYGGATLEGCVSTAENLLDRFPEIDGVFAPCEPVTVAFMRTLDQAGRKASTVIVGFDASESLVNGLRNGKVDALVVQSPFAMGEQGVALLVDSIEGREVAKRIDTGCVVVTRENMETPEAQVVLDPPIDQDLK